MNASCKSVPQDLWPPTFDAAIFDFDGTLADTAHIWYEVDRIFLKRRNLPYPKGYGEQLAALGFAQGAQYTIDLFGLDETVQDICDEWNDIGREMYRQEVTLRKGAAAYIEALCSTGIHCALATTNDQSVLTSMQSCKPHDLFETCVYGAEVNKGKDEPDIYLEAAHRLGVGPDACIVFEDILIAVRTAQSIGMRTCAVSSSDPRQPTAELQSQADYWLGDWRDIPI